MINYTNESITIKKETHEENQGLGLGSLKL